MAGFTLAPEIDVRFRDFDVMGQVHNTLVFIFAEEARTRYYQEVLDVSLEETNSAIVHQQADYVKPITKVETVVVPYRITHIGKSSITSEFEVRANNEVVANGETVHVLIGQDERPAEIPTGWKETIRTFEAAEVTSG